MRKFVYLAMMMVMFFGTYFVEAAVTTLHVNLTTSSPSIDEACCGLIYFEVFTFQVDTTGSYSINYANNNLNYSDPWFWFFDPDTTSLSCNNPAAMATWGGTALITTLTAGKTYTIGANTTAGADQNGGNPVIGSYDLIINGPGLMLDVSHTSPCGGSILPGDADDLTDPDGDGITGSRDNCPFDYNPDQEDGWGSAMGDLCDTDWYNMSGIGISGFEQENGVYHLHGNCTFLPDSSPRCPEVGIFDPAAFTPADMPLDVTSPYAGTWSVWVYYLHSNHGADVYQVNVYTTNPPRPDTLLDDRLEIHVRSGFWQWYQRGGSPRYNGN